MKIRTLGCTVATLGALAVGSMVATPALAGTIGMTFAGLDGANYEAPLNYYNGGAGGLLATGGANYGVSFGVDAITCSNILANSICNEAQIPGGTGANALFFVSGPGDIMNVAAGFDTGFSFYYSAPIYPGSVSVYDGLNGTGNLLATLNLPKTADGIGMPGCDGADYCPFEAAGVTFSGIAESVNFTGAADYIAFAGVTLGSSTPIPEPTTLALLGLALGGLGFMGRKKAI